MDTDQIFEKIEQFQDEGDFRKAYQLCMELLEIDPDNGRAIRLIKKLEKKIQEGNIENIKNNIKVLDPLWEKEKYQELVEKLHELYELAPFYEPLEELIAKAESKLKKQIEDNKNKFHEKYEAELTKMLENDKSEELLLKMSQTEAAYPSNQTLKKIGIRVRIKYIKKELDRNKPLLNSRRFIDIIEFLKKLYQIEPTCAHLGKLLVKYRKKGATHLTDEQQEFVYKGLTQIETFMQMKEYEKAEQIAREVLEVEPRNGKAKKFHKLASKKTKMKIQNEVIAKIEEDIFKLEKEYKANKNNFITI